MNSRLASSLAILCIFIAFTVGDALKANQSNKDIKGPDVVNINLSPFDPRDILKPLVVQSTYMISGYTNKSDNPICGSILLDPQNIVTTARCATNKNLEFAILYGDGRTQKWVKLNRTDAKTIVHSDWKGGMYDDKNNIALIRLNRPLLMAEHVKFADLTCQKEKKPGEDNIIEVHGYSCPDKSENKFELRNSMQVLMKVKSNEACGDLYKGSICVFNKNCKEGTCHLCGGAAIHNNCLVGPIARRSHKTDSDVVLYLGEYIDWIADNLIDSFPDELNIQVQ